MRCGARLVKRTLRLCMQRCLQACVSSRAAPSPPGKSSSLPCLQVRAELGFPPLVIVVIGLIYSSQRAAKLSSTDLREDDAVSVGGATSAHSSRPCAE